MNIAKRINRWLIPTVVMLGSLATGSAFGVDVGMANWCTVFAAPGINEAQKQTLVDAVERATAGKTGTWEP